MHTECKTAALPRKAAIACAHSFCMSLDVAVASRSHGLAYQLQMLLQQLHSSLKTGHPPDMDKTSLSISRWGQ